MCTHTNNRNRLKVTHIFHGDCVVCMICRRVYVVGFYIRKCAYDWLYVVCMYERMYEEIFTEREMGNCYTILILLLFLIIFNIN